MPKFFDSVHREQAEAERVQNLEEQIADLEATNQALVEENNALCLLLAAYKDKYGVLENE